MSTRETSASIRTVEDFERFVDLPQNADRTFEYVGGEIVEVPTNPYTSHIAALFLIELGIYLKQHKIDYITGADGTLVVAIYPHDQTVTIHESGSPTHQLGLDDTLTVEALLPGFQLAIKDLFVTE